MGLMEQPRVDGQLIITPHPVLVDGRRKVPADLRPGESLYAFLQRHVDGLDGEAWAVSIGGRAVPRHLWHHVYPKHGQVIELRGAVGKSAVALVATLALTYFTFGFGAATVGMWGASAVAGAWGGLAAAGVFMAGSVLVNKVLQPKALKAAGATPSVYSLSAPRNQARPYEPLGLLLGTMRIAPDIISNPYTWYEGDEQYLSMVLTPGINVDRVEAIYNGDALLSSYEGVQTWFNGFPGMASETIPLYSNADVLDGGTLLDTSTDPKHTPSAWVQRTSSVDTLRLLVGVEFQIYDRTSKGGDKDNSEQIEIQYRATGTTAWTAFGTYKVTGRDQKTRRVSYAKDVALGQYDVRVRVAGQNTDGSGAEASFTWTTLTSVQRDEASYAGIPRIGIRMQATGQLNGAPDELRCVAHSTPIPVWKGTQWVTEESSNPGAQILAYARGVKDPAGKRIAGMGLPDRQIDVEGLKAFTLHCAALGLTYDNWITDVRSHDDVLSALALAGFGRISWDGGRLSVVWAADEQPLAGVVNMATIKKGQFQIDYTLSGAADGIEYTYLDRTSWEAKTLRVPAPGVTTMLNPAQVTGEGVTSEAHAALLARWHLAQSIYQYKAIGYSTDIEYLSYRPLSMLALQHDLTQWGYGGRIMSAAVVNGVATLQLDEPVPAPASGTAFVGLRIPGERVYRVLPVQPFTGTTQTLTLAGAWPSDAALPGSSDSNPAWDTLWIYDFKQTPGYRVRVVGIRPESDLKGAAVDVVPEGPEFWHYVTTGEYIAPGNGSLLQTRPVASGVKVTENHVVQGDTVFTELQATFEVSGPVGQTVVLTDLDGDGELEQVAQTVTRTATWRIPRAGTYAITVRPYNPDGQAGVAASILYTTRGADAAPVLVDLFDVEQLSGGVRRYTWGFFTDTIQSADFAGVEIRYVAGTVVAPVWDEMTPLGDTGYHPAAFEAVLPASGTWTFACRSRNTAGTLSMDARILTKALGQNLGELQQEQQQWNESTQEILDAFNQAVKDQQQLVSELQAESSELAAESQRQAAALQQQATDLANLQAAIDAADYDASVAYLKGAMVKYQDGIYVAKVDVPAGHLPTETDYWSYLGAYASLAEAVGANAISISQTRAEVSELNGQVDSLTTSVTGLQSSIAEKANASAVTALTTRTTAAENAITSQGNAITSLQNALPGKADASAVTGLTTRVTNAENAITSQGNAITSVTAKIGVRPNLLPNGGAETGPWSSTFVTADWSWGRVMLHGTPSTIGSGGQAVSSEKFFVAAGEVLSVSWDSVLIATAGKVSMDVEWFNSAGTYIGMSGRSPIVPATHNFEDGDARLQARAFSVTAPANTASGRVRFIWESCAGVTTLGIRRVKVEKGALPATAYSSEITQTAMSSATQSLTTRVTQAEGTLTSQGSAVTSLQNALPGKADVSAVSALTTRTTNAENVINSQGSAITSLQNALPGKADASALSALTTRTTNAENAITSQGNAITSVTAKIGVRPNQLPNGGMEQGIWTSGEATSWVVSDANWGRVALYGTPSNLNGGGHAVVSAYFDAAAGAIYTISGDTLLIANAGTVRFDVEWYNSNYQRLGGASSATFSATHDFQDGDARRQARAFQTTAPANSRFGRVRFVWENVTGASAMGFRLVKVEKGSLPATAYSNDATIISGASATQALSARVTQTENGLVQYEASWTMSLDANGRVAGIRSVNNGTLSTIDFVFDKVRFLGPSSGARTELSDGSFRVYAESGVEVVRIGRLT